MSWLGNGFREEAKSLADAYAQMYAPKEEQHEEEKVEQEELSEGGVAHKIAGSTAKAGKAMLDVLKTGAKQVGGAAKVVHKDLTKEETEEVVEGKTPIQAALEADKRLMKLHTKDKPAPKGYEKKEEQDILAAMKDAYEMMYEKKKSGSDKCGEGTYWDKEEKKCKSKKKSGGGGRAIFYGGHSHSHDDDEGESEGGSDGAAAGEAAGGGGGGE